MFANGYVHSIINGETSDLRSFALRCARGMGALIMMRDEPLDTPVPDAFAPSDWNAKKLAEARIALAEIAALTPEEAEERAASDFNTAMEEHIKYAAKEAEDYRRVSAMKASVEDWTTQAEGIKAFMLESLDAALKNGPYAPEPPERKTGPVWRADAMAKASRDIAYHAIENEKEIARTASRNEWLRLFKASLPPEPAIRLATLSGDDRAEQEGGA